MFAENTITIARHNFVDCIAKPAWQHAANSRQAPDAAKLRQHVKDGIRARQQSFIRALVVLNYVDRVEVVRINAVTRQ